MNSLLVLLVLASSPQENVAALPWVVGREPSLVERVGERTRLVFKYSDGEVFAEGTYETHGKPSTQGGRLRWNPVGQGAVYYPTGQVAAQYVVSGKSPSRWHIGQGSLWLLDGRLFAKADRRNRVSLGNFVSEELRRKPELNILPCPVSHELRINGPFWGWTRSPKLQPGVTMLLSVSCFDEAGLDTRSISWFPDGTVAEVQRDKALRRWHPSGRKSFEGVSSTLEGKCWEDEPSAVPTDCSTESLQSFLRFEDTSPGDQQ